jgi:hypothetical protein
MFVVCCQGEVSATSLSLVRRNPTDCDVSLCVVRKPRERGGHRPRWAAEPEKINKTSSNGELVEEFFINELFKVYGRIVLLFRCKEVTDSPESSVNISIVEPT